MVNPAIGIIGLGDMGAGIAASYRRVGYPLAVWDIAEAARAPFFGKRGVAVAEPGAMAAQSKLILFVVPGSAEIEPMLGGWNGILANARKGLVLYDLTTSDPATTKRLARKSARKGICYLDGGMSGGAAGAAAGTLGIMVGGNEAAYRRTRRHLVPIADHLAYLGSSGAGHTMKLIHNLVCHTIFLATAEGAQMAEKAGLGLAAAIDVFNHGNARSFISERRFPDHIVSKSWDGRSTVHNLHKDVGMAVNLADRLGVDAALGRDTYAFLESAVARGMCGQDFTRLYAAFGRIRPSNHGRKKRP